METRGKLVSIIEMDGWKLDMAWVNTLHLWAKRLGAASYIYGLDWTTRVWGACRPAGTEAAEKHLGHSRASVNRQGSCLNL